MSALTHALKKAINAHGEEVNSLELDAPTTKLVMELGYPYLGIAQGDGEAAVQLQPKTAARYISKLAKIPLSSVEQLQISDLQTLHGWLMGFFGEDATPT